jgi:hypothetical protein
VIFHLAVIAAQCAALAAFLILWFFWVRKRIESTSPATDRETTLFPFRCFSWLLIGMVLVTSLVQIHFVRVSAVVHERMAAMADFYYKHDQSARSLDELKSMVERLRREMDTNFQGLRAHHLQQQPARSSNPIGEFVMAGADQPDTEHFVAAKASQTDRDGSGFGREAKAASSRSASETLSGSSKAASASESKGRSMALKRVGRVIPASLQVRKRPAFGSPVVEELAAGQAVKVTEKRVVDDSMWFRVVTPSGHAGWVDYRHVRLDGSS